MTAYNKILPLIPIHWFHIQSYCEYEIYLTEVKHQPDPLSHAVLQGKAVHTMLELEHDLMAGDTEPILLSDAIDKALVSSRPFVMREAHVIGAGLTGCIDQIEFFTDKVRIIDDKPRTFSGMPYFGDRRQVKAYCLAFQAQYPELRQPIFAVIRDRDSGEEIWQKKFDADDVAEVNEALDRITGILNGTRQAQPARPSKCLHCRFCSYCPIAIERK